MCSIRTTAASKWPLTMLKRKSRVTLVTKQTHPNLTSLHDTMSFFNQNSYNPGFSQPAAQAQPYYQQPDLNFYQGGDSYAYNSRPSLEGNVASGSSGPSGPGFGGTMQPVGPWWTAFGTGGFEGEQPLLEGMQRPASFEYTREPTAEPR